LERGKAQSNRELLLDTTYILPFFQVPIAVEGFELSAGRAAEMLSLPSGAFNQLLAERDVPTPAKFDESIQRELKSLAGRKYASPLKNT